ncbi:phosphate/phosphite/phosphonate ABC transporter substrate-binding protein [Oceanicoccus sp. KOV_DT_Chl]|uniref:phosphate/phosphite/phosphonate ABC transporter substrate-binding protein n=1 Tax=Oceanicoccus sp. KOV_DT_Chl TaxID=1904639 RepID=UPI000C7D6BED|nr:PhnD/SsuA/transferrin family substrate-binding protein [Oceanicoccus sp. KOV_DT_Chl]
MRANMKLLLWVNVLVNEVHRCLVLIIGWSLLMSLSLASMAESPALNVEREISIRSFPFFNNKLAQGWWQPLRQHIYTNTGLTVRISIPDDYAALFDEAANGKYDLYLVPDHFVPLMVERDTVKPLLAINLNSQPRIIYRRDEGIEDVTQLRDKCIAMPDKISMASMWAEEWLLTKQISYQVMRLPNFPAVVMSVISGQCEAGVITSSALGSQPPAFQRLIRVEEIPTSDKYWAGIGIVANDALDIELAQRIQTALLTFGKTPATIDYIKNPFYSVPVIMDNNRVEYFSKQYKALLPALKHELVVE